MLSSESKTGFYMVKRQWFFPVKCRVARLAIFAQPPEMWIFFGVAACTGGGGAAKMRPVAVAACAFGFGMATDQRIICEAMVEGGLVELDLLKAPPVMFTVTHFTGLRAGR